MVMFSVSTGFNSRLREEATASLAIVSARIQCFNSRLREEATSHHLTSNEGACFVSTHASVRRRRE